MKKRHGLIGIIISVACVALALRGVDFHGLANTIKTSQYQILPVTITIYIFGYVLRTLRWRMILSPLKIIDLRRTYHVIMIAWTANNLLPARLGEIIRAYLIGKSESISRSASFATIIVERVLDGIALIGALAILLLLYPFPAWARNVGAIGTVAFLGAIAFLLSLYIWREQTLRLFRRLTTWLPDKTQQFILINFEKFLSGLQFLKDGVKALQCLGLSLCIWGIEAVVYYMFFHIVGLNLPFYAAVFTLVIVNMGIIIPSSPGYVGTYQVFAILALAVFGIDKTHALGYAVLLHGMIYLVVTGLGFISMQRLGMQWGDLSKVDMDS